MEERVLKGQLLTHMFSFGENQKVPEFRATELKGAMQYLYRITCPAVVEDLYKCEAELFGGSAGGNEGRAGHASPIQLLVSVVNQETLNWNPLNQRGIPREKLLLHNKQGVNPKLNYLYDESFQIKIRKNIHIQESSLSKKADLDWYKNLAGLSLIMCGMGKRSRKGRGRMMLEEYQLKGKADALKWICSVLNQIAGVQNEENRELYKIENEHIQPCTQLENSDFGKTELERPVIKKVILGSALFEVKECVEKMKQGGVQDFLRRVDVACHKLLAVSSGTGSQGIGDLTREQHIELRATMGAERGKRLASSLIIGLIKTEEGVYPVYTFVKAFEEVEEEKKKEKKEEKKKKIEIDSDCKLREEFIDEVKRLSKGGAR